MTAHKISLQNAKKEKLFYVVANVIVYRDNDGRGLILKRSKNEKTHPGKYCVPGGKLEWSMLDIKKPTRINGDVIDFENAVEDLLAREVREEADIEIERDLKYINSVAYIRPDGTPSILIKFAARYKSGEIKIEESAFSDYQWVNAEEVEKYDCILGINQEVAQAIELFNA